MVCQSWTEREWLEDPLSIEEWNRFLEVSPKENGKFTRGEDIVLVLKRFYGQSLKLSSILDDCQSRLQRSLMQIGINPSEFCFIASQNLGKMWRDNNKSFPFKINDDDSRAAKKDPDVIGVSSVNVIKENFNPTLLRSLKDITEPFIEEREERLRFDKIQRMAVIHFINPMLFAFKDIVIGKGCGIILIDEAIWMMIAATFKHALSALIYFMATEDVNNRDGEMLVAPFAQLYRQGNYPLGMLKDGNYFVLVK